MVQDVQKVVLLPCIVNHLSMDIALGHNEPSSDIVIDQVGCGLVGILDHHQNAELHLQLGFEGFVEAHIYGLDKPGASRGDEVNLDTKCLDGVNNATF